MAIFVLVGSGVACRFVDPDDTGREWACRFVDPDDTGRKERKRNTANAHFVIFFSLLIGVIGENFRHSFRGRGGIVLNSRASDTI